MNRLKRGHLAILSAMLLGGSLFATRSLAPADDTAQAQPDAPAAAWQTAPVPATAEAASSEAVPAQMLRAAQAHYESAQKHWLAASFGDAAAQADQGFSKLLQLPARLSAEQERERDEIRLAISRLVVAMSVAQARQIQGTGEIPLIHNEHVDREIRSFQRGERSFFVSSYERAGQHLPYIQRRLAENHMPAELQWLPLVESGFKLRALSSARALGIWQFIPSTGLRFGLERDRWIDQRMDPERATDAAIAYLRQLHSLFGDWTTALAAYNSGEGNVARAIARQKINYLDSFWDLYPHLPRETRRYVPRFLAAVHIVRDPARHGFDLKSHAQPQPYELVKVDKSLSIAAVAKSLSIDTALLRDLNPELRLGVTPPREHPLRVPAGSGSVLLASMRTLRSEPAGAAAAPAVTRASATSSKTVRYRVRRGDTLGGIARRHGTSQQAIARASNLRSVHRLKIGQTLQIPRSGSPTLTRASAKTEARPKRASAVRYRVRRGDTLGGIARRFKVSQSSIARASNLRSRNSLKVGQVLQIPRRSA
jgi:membrane-bound lytic murein transglycosylase D